MANRPLQSLPQAEEEERRSIGGEVRGRLPLVGFGLATVNRQSFKEVFVYPTTKYLGHKFTGLSLFYRTFNGMRRASERLVLILNL